MRLVRVRFYDGTTRYYQREDWAAKAMEDRPGTTELIDFSLTRAGVTSLLNKLAKEQHDEQRT